MDLEIYSKQNVKDAKTIVDLFKFLLKNKKTLLLNNINSTELEDIIDDIDSEVLNAFVDNDITGKNNDKTKDILYSVLNKIISIHNFNFDTVNLLSDDQLDLLLAELYKFIYYTKDNINKNVENYNLLTSRKDIELILVLLFLRNYFDKSVSYLIDALEVKGNERKYLLIDYIDNNNQKTVGGYRLLKYYFDYLIRYCELDEFVDRLEQKLMVLLMNIENKIKSNNVINKYFAKHKEFLYWLDVKMENGDLVYVSDFTETDKMEFVEVLYVIKDNYLDIINGLFDVVTDIDSLITNFINDMIEIMKLYFNNIKKNNFRTGEKFEGDDLQFFRIINNKIVDALNKIETYKV